ncbi:hypothetical protein DK924_04235 [Pseudoalteromonas sp. meg-B1]|nr:hypothetical protein DK924_04235 [Pseudoalteromonas sp. meg-B1]
MRDERTIKLLVPSETLFMKSKLIRTAEKNGFTKAGSDGAQVRYLKPINNDFSYGFLIGRTGKDDITAVQFGLINHPMWELQQEVEGTKDLNILFLLFTLLLNPVHEESGKPRSLDSDIVSELMQTKIDFFDANLAQIIKDTVRFLTEFRYPPLFVTEEHLLFDGLAHYYGLLYKHLYVSKLSAEEIDSHIDSLLEMGLSERAHPIFRLGLLKQYVGY